MNSKLKWGIGGLAAATIYTAPVVGYTLLVTDENWGDFWRTAATPYGTTTAGLFALGAAGIAFYNGHQERMRNTAVEDRRAAETDRQHEAETERALRQRYTTAVEQLANSTNTISQAGVYAIAALADDWLTINKTGDAQTCVNLLCSYLRTTPSDVDPTTPLPDQPVRDTILSTITAHLRDNTPGESWQRLDYDFTGAHLTNANFESTQFRGVASFYQTHFHGTVTAFDRAAFHGKATWFADAQFHGTTTRFDGAQFRSENTWFDRAQFHGENTSFDKTQFHGEHTWFDETQFRSKTTSFNEAQFRGTATWFARAQFHGENTWFDRAQFRSKGTCFDEAQFHGTTTRFVEAKFHSKTNVFVEAQFHGENTSFVEAQFDGDLTLFVMAQFLGENTSFVEAQLRSETVSFENPAAWRHVTFDWDNDHSNKPDNVSPAEWPPRVSVTDDDVTTANND
ncbi:pentapeptide repeat-containing protein [Gordonia sp. NPDC057258]|uniref:pentapeptide repeat-containing protein n=1 Tax=unclassified Gordonia (in: high G+C Gram-positive bacteria) TaxID=2657482 RepID=UPI0036328DB1